MATSAAGSTCLIAALDAATGQPKWVFVAEYEKKFEAKGLHGYPSAAQTIPSAIYTYTQVPGGDGAALRLTAISVAIAFAALMLSEWLARRAKGRTAAA